MTNRPDASTLIRTWSICHFSTILPFTISNGNFSIYWQSRLIRVNLRQ